MHLSTSAPQHRKRQRQRLRNGFTQPALVIVGVDWLSRPSSDIPKVFGNRPLAVIGASPSGFGTILAQDAWLPVLRTLGTCPWFGGRLMVSRAIQMFDASGELHDEALRQQLEKFLAGFVAFVQKQYYKLQFRYLSSPMRLAASR